MALFKSGQVYVSPTNPTAFYELLVSHDGCQLVPQKSNRRAFSRKYSDSLFADLVHSGHWVLVARLSDLLVHVPCSVVDVSGVCWLVEYSTRTRDFVQLTRVDTLYSRWFMFSDYFRFAEKSCGVPCTPADFREGGVCDVCGCYEKEVESD